MVNTKVIGYYPEGLEITVKDGHATTNVIEPYSIRLPDELKNSGSFAKENPNIENMLVIDTKNDFSMSAFENGKTLAMLTGTSIVYKDKNQIRIQPLGRMPNIVITKSTISGLMAKVQPFFSVILFLIPIVIFLLVCIMHAFFLLYCFFAALLVWGIAKIKKLPIGYKKSYQIAIHAGTIGMLLWLLVALVPSLEIPYVSTLLLVFVAWFNLGGKERSA
jgi:uncharacterized membrane protein